MVENEPGTEGGGGRGGELDAREGISLRFLRYKEEEEENVIPETMSEMSAADAVNDPVDKSHLYFTCGSVAKGSGFDSTIDSAVCFHFPQHKQEIPTEDIHRERKKERSSWPL